METLYLIVKLYIVLLCENIISCEKKFQVEKTLENYYNNYVTINQISKKRSKNHHSKVQKWKGKILERKSDFALGFASTNDCE